MLEKALALLIERHVHGDERARNILHALGHAVRAVEHMGSGLSDAQIQSARRDGPSPWMREPLRTLPPR